MQTTFFASTFMMAFLGAGCGGAGSPVVVEHVFDFGSTTSTDALTDASVASKLVFVSSLTYSGNLGGITGADSKCTLLGNAIGINSAFKAWVSTSAVRAIDHVQGAGPWHDRDGAVVFQNRDGLLTAPLIDLRTTEKAILITDQHGAGSYAWTGTDLGGTSNSSSCGDWSSDQGLGLIGNPNLMDAQWTHDGPDDCGQVQHLYCFEQ